MLITEISSIVEWFENI